MVSRANQNRIVTGAHYGLMDWLAQRVTAAVMAVYMVLLAAVLIVAAPQDYAAWKAIFTQPVFRIATLLFLLSLYWHAWIGMRDIFMDYIHPVAIRLTLQIGVILSLVVYTIWSVQILWG